MISTAPVLSRPLNLFASKWQGLVRKHQHHLSQRDLSPDADYLYLWILHHRSLLATGFTCQPERSLVLAYPAVWSYVMSCCLSADTIERIASGTTMCPTVSHWPLIRTHPQSHSRLFDSSRHHVQGLFKGVIPGLRCHAHLSYPAISTPASGHDSTPWRHKLKANEQCTDLRDVKSSLFASAVVRSSGSIVPLYSTIIA